MANILTALNRVLASNQVHVATLGIATKWVAAYFAAPSIPPDQRAWLWIAFIGAAAVDVREVLNSFSEASVAAIAASTPTSATPVQVIPPSSAPAATPVVAPPTTQTGVNAVPGKVILPLLLIALFMVGCSNLSTSDPQLDTYREGLHAIDEPLYQAHAQLMTDAVKAGIRTPTDQQVVTAGIAGAEALYQQSKVTEGTSSIVPATQPTK